MPTNKKIPAERLYDRARRAPETARALASFLTLDQTSPSNKALARRITPNAIGKYLTNNRDLDHAKEILYNSAIPRATLLKVTALESYVEQRQADEQQAASDTHTNTPSSTPSVSSDFNNLTTNKKFDLPTILEMFPSLSSSAHKPQSAGSDTTSENTQNSVDGSSTNFSDLLECNMSNLDSTKNTPVKLPNYNSRFPFSQHNSNATDTPPPKEMKTIAWKLS